MFRCLTKTFSILNCYFSNLYFRISRIAQPIRRGSKPTEPRSKSEENDSKIESNLVPSSLLKVPRSASASRTTSFGNRISATPMRTPLRVTQFTAVPMSTTEKLNNDKKWIQNQINRINDFLPNIPGVGAEIVKQGGLRSITTKQFNSLITILLQEACGKKIILANKPIIDQIIEILPQIEYPYTINKSSLKTINAGHSFPHLVILIGWLIDFTTASDTITSIEQLENITIFDNEFPDPEYVLHFINETKRAFSLWNNKQDVELENLNASLVDRLINTRTGITNMNKIEEEIKNLRTSIKNLREQRIKQPNNEEFLKLDLNVQNLESQLSKTKDDISKLQTQLKKSKSKIKEQNHAITLIRKGIDDQKNALQHQKISVKDRDELLEQIHYKEVLLEAKMKAHQEMENMGQTYQIKYSRLFENRIECALQLNNQLYKLQAEHIIDPSMNINHLIIDCRDPRSIESKIPILSEFVQQLKSKKFIDQKDTLLKIQNLEKSIFEITNTKTHNEEMNNELKLKLETQSISYQADIKLQHETLNNLQTDNHKMIVRCNEIVENIEQVGKNFEEMKEKVNIQNKINSELDDLIIKETNKFIQEERLYTNKLENEMLAIQGLVDNLEMQCEKLMDQQKEILSKY